MATATSVIQDFTDALIANLNARAGMAGIFVSDGYPPHSILQSKDGWLGLLDVTGGQKWAAIDRVRKPREEVFTIDCIISVVANATPMATEVQPVLNRQAMAILAEIEDELRVNPTQGINSTNGLTPAGYVLESQVCVPVKLRKGITDTQREAALEFGVEVKARL